MTQRRFYILACALGTLIPWAFFGSYFAQNGIALGHFLAALFANGAAGGFAADVLVSLGVFWVWAACDAREGHVRHWWLIFPASLTVGLSLALPLYLYLRSGRD